MLYIDALYVICLSSESCSLALDQLKLIEDTAFVGVDARIHIIGHNLVEVFQHFITFQTLSLNKEPRKLIELSCDGQVDAIYDSRN